MLIGGLQKFTALDYPEKIAATIFTVGCNFRCPYCHNIELVDASKFEKENALAEDYVLNFLESRQGDLDGVCISGGEPTLQRDLFDFIVKIKEMGFYLKLDTNGSNQKIVDKLMDSNLVDYFAIDIKTAFDKYGAVKAQAFGDIVLDTIDSIARKNVSLELRTTMVPGIIDIEDIQKIIERLNQKNPLILKSLFRYSLQGFRPQRTLDRDYLKVKPYEIEVLESTAEKLRKYCSRVDILN